MLDYYNCKVLTEWLVKLGELKSSPNETIIVSTEEGDCYFEVDDFAEQAATDEDMQNDLLARYKQVTGKDYEPKEYKTNGQRVSDVFRQNRAKEALKQKELNKK